MSRAQELQLRAQEIARQQESLRQERDRLERQCLDGKGHVWDKMKFDPIYREGYKIPSDVEQGIYLGVDTRLSSIWVPSETTKRWARQCQKCGVTQYTSATKTENHSGEIPGTTATRQVPVFPDDWKTQHGS